MLARILVAATLCLMARAPVRAEEAPGELPLVLGESGTEPEAAEPVGAADGVPMVQPAEVSVVVETPPPAGMLGPEPAGAVVSCTDEPAAWTGYALADALFMQRANTEGPLAVESQSTSDPGAPVIAAGDVGYPTAPGLRIFQGWRGPDFSGFEVGYLGTWGMHADALAVSPDALLALPGQLGLIAGSGFDAATAIQPVLSSSLNSVEINVFATRVYDGCRQHDPLPWRRSSSLLADTVSTADWLVGIRWAGLDETATLDVTAANSDTTAYRVTSSSHLVGPQIGHRRRIEWNDWAFEGWAKVALAGSFLSMAQSAVVGPFDLVQVRPPQSASFNGVGMIGDLNATLVRRIGNRWGVRAGYTLLWLADVAPAANQWDFTDTSASGRQLATGTVFLHGATLGLEASW